LNGQVQQPPVPGDRDVIEAQALRRRQVLGAFLQGQETRREAWTGVPLRGILTGLALAILIAVVSGSVALVGATQSQQPRPVHQPGVSPTAAIPTPS
jgi:hypothetical protein